MQGESWNLQNRVEVLFQEEYIFLYSEYIERNIYIFYIFVYVHKYIPLYKL